MPAAVRSTTTCWPNTRHHKVEFRRLPDTVLAALREQAEIVLIELAAKDAFAKRVYDSFVAFREQVRAWSAVSEVPNFQSR